jgi:hypothetical protein
MPSFGSTVNCGSARAVIISKKLLLCVLLIIAELFLLLRYI